jgi:hypothetical protein
MAPSPEPASSTSPSWMNPRRANSVASQVHVTGHRFGPALGSAAGAQDLLAALPIVAHDRFVPAFGQKAPQASHGIGHARVVPRVVGRGALAPVAQHARLAQLAEVGRDARLRQQRDLCDLGHRKLVAVQQMRQPDPGWVGKEPQSIDGFGKCNHRIIQICG